MTTVNETLRRSPLQYEVAPGASNAAASLRCAIADLSTLPRIGFKGWNVWATLAGAGLAVPDRNNLASRFDGGVCARLSNGEALILAGVDESELPEVVLELEDRDGFYVVPRRDTHAWIALGGSEMWQVMAKLCAVDLRPDRFADLAIAQTIVAGVGAIVLRCDLGDIPVWHLLADSMSARCLWASVRAVAAAHGGHPVAFGSLRSLERPSERR